MVCLEVRLLKDHEDRPIKTSNCNKHSDCRWVYRRHGLLGSEAPGLAQNFTVDFNWLRAYNAMISTLCIERSLRRNKLTKDNPIHPCPFIGRSNPRVRRAPLDNDVTLFQKRGLATGQVQLNRTLNDDAEVKRLSAVSGLPSERQCLYHAIYIV